MKQLLVGRLALAARAIRFAAGADLAWHGMAAGRGLRLAPRCAPLFSAASGKCVSRSAASLAAVAAVVMAWTVILPLSRAEAQCATTGTSPGTVTLTCLHDTTTTNTTNLTSPNPSTIDRIQNFANAPLVGQVNSGFTIDGLGLALVGSGTVKMTNNGTITTSVGNGFGVELETVGNTGSTVFNNTGSVATGSNGSAVVSFSNLTVTNSGTISAAASTGIFGQANLTVTNSGTISAIVDGVFGNANLTVTNSGTISGGAAGIHASGLLTVTNSISGIISAGTQAQTAIIADAGLNLTNFGTISGTVVAIGTASSSIVNFGKIDNGVFFTGSGSSLTLAPGSVITGLVVGSGADILQLGGSSGAATFNLSDIGAGQQYQDFLTFNKIDNSTWTLTGSGNQA
jgi:hypothetical protein